MIVCQSHPNSSAMSLTDRPEPPTWRVTQRAARSVNRALRGAIVGSHTVQDPAGHSDWAHHQRCLCHTNLAGRPKHVMSTNTTAVVSFTLAFTPHSRHHP